MATIIEITTRLRVLAAEVGGDHHTNKETEKLLNEIARELEDINVNLSIVINKAVAEMDAKYTGVSEQYRFLTLKERNIKEHADKHLAKQTDGSDISKTANVMQSIAGKISGEK